MLKFIYTLFIGILFATLVGVGIAAFYPNPKMPDYPISTDLSLAGQKQSEAQTKRMEAQQRKYDVALKEYQKKEQEYSKNVSIVSLVAAIIALVISLTIFKSLLMIADGLLLGGLLTLIYSIIRGFSTEDNMFRFVVVAIGFVIAIIIGYLKFIPSTKTKK
jgi:predicted histidine transporter YuiF (NhaC family)